jgi:hypothetical protein
MNRRRVRRLMIAVAALALAARFVHVDPVIGVAVGDPRRQMIAFMPTGRIVHYRFAAGTCEVHCYLR